MPPEVAPDTTAFESRLWHSLLESSVDAIVVIDESGHILAFNPAAEAMFGHASPRVIGQNVNLLMPEPDHGRHDGYLSRYKETGVKHIMAYRREVRGRRADGSTFPMELSVNEVAGGRARVFIGTIRDVSANRKAEQELMMSKQRLADAQRIAKLGHWDWNILTNELQWSDEIYRIFGLTVGEFEATYPAFLDRVHPEDRPLVEAAVAGAIAGKGRYGIDHRIVMPNGEVRYVHESAEVTIEGGRQARMLGTVQDITERKLAEQAIRAALDEKEVLFKEVHHRVKNNLQIIAGILTLQKAIVADQATTAVLESTEHRVRAMALVHERLYSTNELKQVDIAAYLHELVDRLTVTMMADPGRLQVTKDFAPLVVDLDTAVPCGLIVNELMTNTLKYGLVEGRGVIELSLRRTGENVELRFEDHGPGYTGNLDELEASPGLGLRLVRILGHQLRGRFEIRSAGGFKFVLRWPKKEVA